LTARAAFLLLLLALVAGSAAPACRSRAAGPRPADAARGAARPGDRPETVSVTVQASARSADGRVVLMTRAGALGRPPASAPARPNSVDGPAMILVRDVAAAGAATAAREVYHTLLVAAAKAVMVERLLGADGTMATSGGAGSGARAAITREGVAYRLGASTGWRETGIRAGPLLAGAGHEEPALASAAAGGGGTAFALLGVAAADCAPATVEGTWQVVSLTSRARMSTLTLASGRVSGELRSADARVEQVVPLGASYTVAPGCRVSFGGADAAVMQPGAGIGVQVARRAGPGTGFLWLRRGAPGAAADLAGRWAFVGASPARHGAMTISAAGAMSGSMRFVGAVHDPEPKQISGQLARGRDGVLRLAWDTLFPRGFQGAPR
jgi:hypothetical protein